MSLPFRGAPIPFSFFPFPLAPGAPEAPECPSGVAAKAPRRFPGGGSGGAPTAGRRFSAMTRPRSPKDALEYPEAETDGGGATIWGPPPNPRATVRVRCSDTGNWGAGAITELRPIFRSPIGRAHALSTRGGGATTELCSVGAFWRCVRREASGGGLTTEACISDAIRVISAAGIKGTGGIASRGLSILSDHSTMFGIATSRFNLTLGGATKVCERLSASGGTEMMGCRANSRSGLLSRADCPLRVSMEGRYSDGW
jgi:hypothetical protein